jgi:hypothetical protein
MTNLLPGYKVQHLSTRTGGHDKTALAGRLAEAPKGGGRNFRAIPADRGVTAQVLSSRAAAASKKGNGQSLR